MNPKDENPPKFEYLPKTADSRFRAFGSSIEELFINSAIAMINIMIDYKKIKRKKAKKIQVSSESLDKLLIKFLEEILFVLDVDGFLTGEIKSLRIKKDGKDYKLNAVLLGDDNIKDYEMSSGIKAVTYNDFVFKKTKEGFIAEITLDT